MATRFAPVFDRAWKQHFVTIGSPPLSVRTATLSTGSVIAIAEPQGHLYSGAEARPSLEGSLSPFSFTAVTAVICTTRSLALVVPKRVQGWSVDLSSPPSPDIISHSLSPTRRKGPRLRYGFSMALRGLSESPQSEVAVAQRKMHLRQHRRLCLRSCFLEKHNGLVIIVQAVGAVPHVIQQFAHMLFVYWL